MIQKFILFFILLIATTSTYAHAQTTSINLDQANETIVEVDGSKIFCRTIGNGSPVIVVHGGPGLSQDYLLPHMYKLAENHFVIFYDQRGCGQSTGEINDNTVNIETFVNDIEAIRKAFNFDKVSILGHSWGGFVAMEYAIAYPDAVNKLVLSNSMSATSEDYLLFIQEFERRLSTIREELEAIHHTQGFFDADPDTIERVYRLIFSTQCYLSEKANLLNLYMPSTAVLNAVKVFECFHKSIFTKSFNLHESLKKLRIPTLIIHGDSDPIPHSTAQNIHESIAGSQYVLMEQCGHFPFVEDPVAYFNHLNEFL